ncbi:unnamed protein product [Phytophthora fragariaefolia]|uniref:Unnamed protein product n=1 Tax=Phytophthora fragariaefolia TaxID=1490495 RepID=A0A9W6WRI6_9STRA|nr:unnamed protein product [Phytophthora fragariaefolia]
MDSSKPVKTVDSTENGPGKGRFLEDFSRKDVDGKKAQNRFITLFQQHKRSNKSSELASGVFEADGERKQLLDELGSQVRDHKLAQETQSEKEKKKKGEKVAAGIRAREAAMRSLGKRGSDGSERKKPTKRRNLKQSSPRLPKTASRRWSHVIA